MLTHDGYYRQVDGLAMGSPPATHFAKGWLDQFDGKINEEAKLFSRYMDDTIRDIKSKEKEGKLQELNSLHASLKFTMEEEDENGQLPVLDLKASNVQGTLIYIIYLVFQTHGYRTDHELPLPCTETV